MRFLKKRSLVFYLGFLLILTMAIGGSIAAFADSSTGATVAVNGGNLSETGPANVSATPVTLTGDDQTTIYSLGLTVTDPRGNGTGWNLTITSTLFDNGGGHQLASNASSINAAPSVVCSGVGGHCTNPDDSAISYPVGVPAGASAPTPVKFFDAAANTGLGKFTITPAVTVSIPGNTYAGSYTSTVSVAVVSGP
jgi:WxL domain surface cell wall-binding